MGTPSPEKEPSAQTWPAVRDDSVPPDAQTLAAESASTDGLRPVSSSPLDSQGEPFGRYRLLQKLGQGGMGVVWKAWDLQLRRIVALKQILWREGDDEKRIDRFLREARLAAKLHHPSIVAVHDVGMFKGEHYFTTDFVEGRPLDVALREGVPRKTVVGWIRCVAEALDYAHAQGVIHRDVKPPNVLIDTQGRPFVLDFGLAKEVQLAPEERALTRTGALLCTPQYMSPEQANGEIATLGPASDQFSLGAVLYEALCRRPAFEGNTVLALTCAVLGKDPVPPRSIDPSIHADLETICMKALEKDPPRRYPSMGEMAADLGRYLEGEPIRARPTSVLGRLARKVSRHRVASIAILCAGAFAIAMGAYVAVSHRKAARDIAAAHTAEADARTALRKAGLAGNVLARWVTLADTVRALDASFHSDLLAPDDPRRLEPTPWQRVEEFMRETPSDPTSQATMRALAGWARRLAGHEDEGIAWMRQSRELDADLPYGDLMQALVCLSKYLDTQPWPTVCVKSSGLEIGPVPPETQEARTLREEMKAHVARAAAAGVWGEGIALDFRRALDGVQALQEARYSDAEKALSAVIGTPAMRVFEVDVRCARGKARYYQSEFEEAKADLEEAVAARPEQAVLHVFLASVRCTSGKEEAYRQAEVDLDRALQLSPGLVSARNNRGNVRLGLKEYDRAVEDFDAILAVSPDDADAWNNRGNARFGKGDYARAIEDYSKALSLDATFVTPRQNRGIARVAANDLKGAREDLDAAIAKGPPSAEAHLYRGVLRQAQGDLAGAIEDFDAALGIVPRYVDVLFNRGRAWLAKGNATRAMADWTAALAQDPHHLSSREARAVCRLQAGDNAGAVSDYEEALKINPKSPAWRNNLGIARLHLGDADGAMREFDEALRQDPTSAEAYHNRATAWEQRGDLKRVIADCDAALKINPRLVEAYIDRGYGRFGSGDAQGAIADYTAALQVDPNHLAALANRGILRDQTGDGEGAKADLARALSLAPADWPQRPQIEAILRRLKAQ